MALGLPQPCISHDRIAPGLTGAPPIRGCPIPIGSRPQIPVRTKLEERGSTLLGL